MARVSAAISAPMSGRRQALGHIVAATMTGRHQAAEAGLRRSVPVLILVFFAILLLSVIIQARDTHDRALAAAAAETDLLASLFAAEIESQTAALPGQNPRALLSALAQSHSLGLGRQLLISDRFGDVTAAIPALPAQAASRDGLFLQRPAASLLVGSPGVSRLALSGGSESLVSYRSLKALHGQLALVQPLDEILNDWWINALRSALLLASACAVLAVICWAYLWQARRARELDRVAETLRTRVDAALSRGGCGLWDWDIGRGRIYWSDSMYDMLGMRPASTFLSMNELRAIIHPEDERLLTARLKSSANQNIDKILRLRNSAGEWVWLRARAQILNDGGSGEAHLVGIAVDVTEEILRADKVKTADLRLRDAVESVSDAFVVWDADAKLVLSNSKFQELRQAGVVGGCPGKAGAAATPGPCAIPTVLKAYDAKSPDGRWFQFDERQTKDGGYVSVGREVTAFKEHEEKLLASKAELTATVTTLQRTRQSLEAQAQQLAELAERYLEQKTMAQSANLAKVDFLANMSHELRTPLNAIIGFSEMMENGVFGPLGNERYYDYAANIKKSGEYLLNLVTDILDMSRLESGRMRLQRSEFPLAGMIRDCVNDYAVAARAKNIHVKADGWPDVRLRADKAAIQRVLKTLIANAVKFTPTGGRLSVRARLVGEAVNIYVEDSGAGIAPSAVSRVGRPFVQIESKLEDGMKGSGLGLAIARSLAELHGGAIRIRSVEGSGTIVMVHLPGAAVMPAQLALAAG